MDKDQSSLLASFEAKTSQQAAMAERSAFLQLQRDPQALYNHPNAINRCSGKIFSQNGEDGIIFEIVRRLGLKAGVFAEYGVGDGRENNTLALVAAGWRGFWIGGEELVFDTNPDIVARPRFVFDKQWVTLDNVAEIYQHSLGRIREPKTNLISMDLDGNDIYLVDRLLNQGAAPEVFVVEYNAKFRPPIEFIMDYDATHVWDGLDYFGASLTSYCKLFEKHGYFPVCCDLTGLNAFFVKNEFRSAFPEVPDEPHLIYESPKYFLTGLYFSGHIMSPRTIRKIFSDLQRGSEGAEILKAFPRA